MTYFLEKNFSVYFPPQRIKDVIKNLKINKFFIKDRYYDFTINLNSMKKESIKTVKDHMTPKEVIAKEELKKILTYIENEKWQAIFITTPFTQIYNQNIENIDRDAYKIRIYDNIKEIEKEMNKKYLYLDYSHDKRFENNLEYFYDDDHLNKKE